MTPADFTSALNRLGLSQADFRRLVERMSSERIGAVSVNRWCTGARRVNPLAAAIVTMLERLPEDVRQSLLTADG